MPTFLKSTHNVTEDAILMVVHIEVVNIYMFKIFGTLNRFISIDLQSYIYLTFRFNVKKEERWKIIKQKTNYPS